MHDVRIEFAVERTVKIMVWSAIAYRSRSSLLFVRGNMTDAMLMMCYKPLYCLIYMAVHTFFFSNTTLHHIAGAGDMDFSKTLMFSRGYSVHRILFPLNINPSQTPPQLIHEIQNAWNELPKADIDHHV